jgi:hypothetical protein
LSPHGEFKRYQYRCIRLQAPCSCFCCSPLHTGTSFRLQSENFPQTSGVKYNWIQKRSISYRYIDEVTEFHDLVTGVSGISFARKCFRNELQRNSNTSVSKEEQRLFGSRCSRYECLTESLSFLFSYRIATFKATTVTNT